MKMGKKGWISLGVVAILIVLIWTSLAGGKVDTETAIVQSESLQVYIRNEGYTRLVNAYRVSSPVSGLLQRVDKEIGARVEQGEPLFSVLPLALSNQSKVVTDARIEAVTARLNQAETALKGAVDAKSQAEATLKRQRELAVDQIITAEQLELAVLAVSDAERLVQSSAETVLQVKAELKIEQIQGAPTGNSIRLSTVVKSPTSGAILAIYERNETSVVPGTPILEIGDARLLEVVVDVLSEDAVTIEVADRVTVSGWGGEAVEGTVLRIEPSAFTKISVLGVEEQRVNVIVALAAVPASLGVGYRVEAAILTEETESSPVVPLSAVFQETGNWYVFVVEGDTVHKRLVQPGLQSADKMVVGSGLEEGDEVVIYASSDIKEGTRIAR